MNKWQERFCQVYYRGKIPKDKQGRYKYDLLGSVRDEVIVGFPDGQKVFIVGDELNIPNGKINAESLSSNIPLWISRGYSVTTR